jgi:ribosomal protein S18 acetylase RimI-like enzyme
MAISESISRLRAYHARNGLAATVRRAGLAAKRALFSGHSVLFYCDLSSLKGPAPELPNSLTVERKRSSSELASEDLQTITSFWNPELATRNLKQRFDLGASLWLIRSNGRLAGYGWTLTGRTVEPHYFPLSPDDVQFLDFHVFSKYRGRAIDWFLMTHILHTLAAEGLTRAFGEAAEWNHASLSSFKMTPFRQLGTASKITLFGHTLVWWPEIQTSLPAIAHSEVRRSGAVSNAQRAILR